jgi:hypothetical protein
MMNREEVAQIKTAWIRARFALIHSLVSGELIQGDAISGLPEQHLGGGRAILRLAIAGMGGGFTSTIRRGDKAEMEGDVVDRSRRIRSKTNGEITEGRVTSTKGALVVTHYTHTPAIRRDEHVITRLGILTHMGRAEQIQRVFLRGNCFMQNDEPGHAVHRSSLRVHVQPLVIIGGIGGLKAFRWNPQVAETALDCLQGELGGPLLQRTTGTKAELFVSAGAMKW